MIALLSSLLLLACGDTETPDSGDGDGGASDGGGSDGGSGDGGATDGGDTDGGASNLPSVEEGTVVLNGYVWTQFSVVCTATEFLIAEAALSAAGAPQLRMLAQFTSSATPTTGWYGNPTGLILNLQLADGSGEWLGQPGEAETVWLEADSGAGYELIWNDSVVVDINGGPDTTSSGWLRCML